MVCALSICAAAASPAFPADAQEFPNRAIHLIVTSEPGSGGDRVARIVGAAMQRYIGQPVLIENRSGAGGVTGTEAGARAPADGYTLTLGTTSTLLTSPALHRQPPYKVERDFAAVALLARTPFVIVTGNTPDSPRDVGELLDRLRAGGASYASNGVGTIGHLASAFLLARQSLQAVHIPYRGSTVAMTDVANGNVLLVIDSVAAALPLIRAGRVRALAITSNARSSLLPEVPTVEEAGIGFMELGAWWGLLVPDGTPLDRIETLSHAAWLALGDMAVQADFRQQGLEPLWLDAAQFDGYIREQIPYWAELMRGAGIASQ